MRNPLKQRASYFEVLQKQQQEVKDSKKYVINRLNTNLSRLNLKTPAENLSKSLQVVTEAIVITTIYFLLIFILFNKIWYLRIFTVISALLFFKLYIDIRIELLEIKINKDIPKMIRKVSHYMVSVQGNIVKALEKAELTVPISTRAFVTQTLNALKSEQPELEIEHLKERTYSRWICMFYDMALFAKKYGDKTSESDKVITANLKKLTQITSYINLKRGYDNIELLWMQLFTFFLPILTIPATQYYYHIVHADMGGASIYQTLEAQNIAAKIFLLSNVATLFINWIRKDN